LHVGFFVRGMGVLEVGLGSEGKSLKCKTLYMFALVRANGDFGILQEFLLLHRRNRMNVPRWILLSDTPSIGQRIGIHILVSCVVRLFLFRIVLLCFRFLVAVG